MRTIVQTEEEWAAAIAQINSANIAAWDWETAKTDNWSRRFPLGVSFCVPDGRILNSWYLPVGHLNQENLPESLHHRNRPIEWLSQVDWQNAEWVAHNAKFDLYQNQVNKLELPKRFRCTQIQAHLLDETRFSYKLADLAHDILHAEKMDLSSAEKFFGWEEIPISIMGEYAMVDTELCFALNRLQAPFIEEQGLEAVFSESMEYVHTLMDVEAAGLPIDVDRAGQAAQACDQGIQAALGRLGWDPGKRGQAVRILHGDPVAGGLGLPVLKRSPRPPRNPMIDRAVLTRLQTMVPDQPEIVNLLQDVIDYRMFSKAKSTWFEGFLNFLDDEGMIHPGFKQDGTGTGRISSEKPNLQQIPRT